MVQLLVIYCVFMYWAIRDVVASFFAKSLKKVKEGLATAYRKSGNQAKVCLSFAPSSTAQRYLALLQIVVVGGMASSSYVFSELQKWSREVGASISRPDGPRRVACFSRRHAFMPSF
jgi:hypothetical protein